MGIQGNTEYRPEQMRAEKILSDVFVPEYVFTEYKVRQLEIDKMPTHMAILDLAIVVPRTVSRRKNRAIRLMGGIHLSSETQRKKDSWQKVALIEADWEVIDFWEDKMPNLWSKKRSEETDKLARDEVLKRIGYI